MWHRKLWLIDHGATLYFHHAEGWMTDRNRARAPFPLISHHVLLRKATASGLRDADAALGAALTADRLEQIVDQIPEAWLEDGGAQRAAYQRYLGDRLTSPPLVRQEAAGAPL